MRIDATTYVKNVMSSKKNQKDLKTKMKMEQIKVNGKIRYLIRKVYDQDNDCHFYYTTERDEPYCDLIDKIEVIQCQDKD